MVMGPLFPWGRKRNRCRGGQPNSNFGIQLGIQGFYARKSKRTSQLACSSQYSERCVIHHLLVFKYVFCMYFSLSACRATRTIHPLLHPNDTSYAITRHVLLHCSRCST